jgi:hypothetical protein
LTNAVTSNRRRTRSSVRLVRPSGQRALCVALVLGTVGCASAKRIPNAPTNPTSYAFPRKHAEVSACLRKLESDGVRVKGDHLFAITVDDAFEGYEHIFEPPENRLDVVLWSYSASESDVYYLEGEWLQYYADFHVHIGPPPGPPIQVTVHAINARVVVGKKWTIGHAWRANVNEDVPGTTIEEYIILRAIGDCLGVTDMPPLELPKPQLLPRQETK